MIYQFLYQLPQTAPMLGSHTVEGDPLKQSPIFSRLSHPNSKTPSWLGMQLIWISCNGDRDFFSKSE